MPVIPATWEAEAGESLEPGKQRMQLAKIMPLHFNLGDKVVSKTTNIKQNSNDQCPEKSVKNLLRVEIIKVKSKLSDFYPIFVSFLLHLLNVFQFSKNIL